MDINLSIRVQSSVGKGGDMQQLATPTPSLSPSSYGPENHITCYKNLGTN
uniref:Uncharacterized protein n=1 Tax=Arundo donax TaxID=35708 RepID=A0A0A8YDR6_ARUDO